LRRQFNKQQQAIAADYRINPKKQTIVQETKEDSSSTTKQVSDPTACRDAPPNEKKGYLRGLASSFKNAVKKLFK
jgi:hypothetical protein